MGLIPGSSKANDPGPGRHPIRVVRSHTMAMLSIASINLTGLREIALGNFMQVPWAISML
jgi:hypothetical protein